jgi:hypothetical protein
MEYTEEIDIKIICYEKKLYQQKCNFLNKLFFTFLLLTLLFSVSYGMCEYSKLLSFHLFGIFCKSNYSKPT